MRFILTTTCGHLIICIKDLKFFNLKVIKSCFYFKLILANSGPVIPHLIDLFHHEGLLLANLKPHSTPKGFMKFHLIYMPF